MRFRTAALRGSSRFGAAFALTTIAVLIGSYLPVAYAGVLLLSTVAAVSGGGRELLPREQAVAFPVSPTTDHLGALLMAPINIAWLLQAWAVLGATAYATGGVGTPSPSSFPCCCGW